MRRGLWDVGLRWLCRLTREARSLAPRIGREVWDLEGSGGREQRLGFRSPGVMWETSGLAVSSVS